MKHDIHMTHNRLVAGSSPAGATKFIKDLGRKLARSFLFFSNLGDVMGDVTSPPLPIENRNRYEFFRHAGGCSKETKKVSRTR